MKFVKFIKFSTGIVFVCVLVGIISSAAAQICLKSDCAGLGYSSTATACQNHFDMLKCPFDATKAVCGGEVKAAGSGIDSFYYNGKLYLVKTGSGGVSYAGAERACSGEWRLPTQSEALRMRTLNGKFIKLSSMNGAAFGIWTSDTCGSGQHLLIAISGPSCKSDTYVSNVSYCVAEN